MDIKINRADFTLTLDFGSPATNPVMNGEIDALINKLHQMKSDGKWAKSITLPFNGMAKEGGK